MYHVASQGSDPNCGLEVYSHQNHSWHACRSKKYLNLKPNCGFNVGTHTFRERAKYIVPVASSQVLDVVHHA
jgi:hypothetical protein